MKYLLIAIATSLLIACGSEYLTVGSVTEIQEINSDSMDEEYFCTDGDIFIGPNFSNDAICIEGQYEETPCIAEYSVRSLNCFGFTIREVCINSRWEDMGFDDYHNPSIEISPDDIFDDLLGVPAGTFIKFTGTISLNNIDSTIQNRKDLKFSSVDFKVGKVESGVLKNFIDVNVNRNIQLPIPNSLNLSELGVSIDLNDQAFTGCGDYAMFITVIANNWFDEFVSSTQVNFNRPDSYCR